MQARERGSGVLLHVTSLPGAYGIGDLGEGARRFVDFLARAGQRWWQMLPLHPIGGGASPYDGVSAFAGNPLLIDLQTLVREGWLRVEELPTAVPHGPADYARAAELRTAALRRAFAVWRPEHDDPGALQRFRDNSRAWLPDYALFIALRAAHRHEPWMRWPEDLRHRDPAALARAREQLATEIAFVEFEQFVFDRQWRALRCYAHSRGIGIIGDVPIFLAHDSADVWREQRLFLLDGRGQPTHVSGVPPDAFSATGQRWGMPLHRWSAHRRQRYRWWIERFRTALARSDLVRLDHFVGYAHYWAVGASQETAIEGKWAPTPGRELFTAIRTELGLGVLPFIAEDLGSVTPAVVALRDALGLPGMRVLQFSYGDDPNERPERWPVHAFGYSGTHDNETLAGWLANADLEVRNSLSGRHHALRTVFASPAEVVIVPMQDLLGLGNEARMNTPGRADGNWLWRMPVDACDDRLADELRRLCDAHQRNAAAREPPAMISSCGAQPQHSQPL
jgi:4-alpha-glucanotransferase